MKHIPLPPASYLRELFSYNPIKGTLHWRIKRVGVKPHKPAGCIHPDGRTILRIDGTNYWIHRIIWCWVSGNDPGEMEIDHTNRDHSDNSCWNLRLATSSQQKQNRSYNGKYLKGTAPTGNKTNPWRAYIGTKHIGVFPTEEEAHQAYIQEGISQYGEFFNQL